MSADCITFDKKGNFFAFDGQYDYGGSVTVSEGKPRFLGYGKVFPDSAGKLVAAVSEPLTGRYHRLTPNVIGKIIAKALLKGATVVEFETCSVTVNYLVEMLRFAGKHGWFHDVLSTTSDHAFNGNSPTPGFYCGEVRQLREEASEMRKYAHLARCAYQYTEAENAELVVRDINRRIRRLLSR